MTCDVLICFFYHPHHEPSEMPMYKGVEASVGLRAPYTGLKAFATGHLQRLE